MQAKDLILPRWYIPLHRVGGAHCILWGHGTPFRFRSNCIGGTRDLEPVLHRTHAGLATSSDGSTAGALLTDPFPESTLAGRVHNRVVGIMIWSDACHELTFGPKTGEVQNFGFHALWIGRFNSVHVYMVIRDLPSTNSANPVLNARISRGFTYFMFHRVDAKLMSTKLPTMQPTQGFRRDFMRV